MKIITENNAYIQKNDIAYLNNTTLPIPASIFLAIFSEGVVMITDLNRNDFLEFTNPDDIEYLKSLDWIIDYNEVKDYSLAQLQDLGASILGELHQLNDTISLYSESENENKAELELKHELLKYKLMSLRDISLYKQGKLKLELPNEENNRTRYKKSKK